MYSEAYRTESAVVGMSVAISVSLESSMVFSESMTNKAELVAGNGFHGIWETDFISVISIAFLFVLAFKNCCIISDS